MGIIKRRAKHKQTYTEDPIYNNLSYRFDWKIVGKNIARRRLELGYTQQDLSDITGIPSVMISQFENNLSGKHPNNSQLVILMHALKMDANAIYNGNIDTATMTKTDRNLLELIDNIRAEIYKSELYKGAQENDRRNTPKPLGLKHIGYNSPKRNIAEDNNNYT
ncbi:helix-turn-helix domain-containing protein [Oribacterium sp. WCC10]|uniref:helix-turn-helix domain-containing protein n=1 Tax=Oribacterium sp. WCC10 TaxID=1855343 RepID=UPI0008F18717|nr:helix-turn-helix domain-containing protein [Oribacterium sp. WCC10]SFG54500.1 Transcriptional regulator, contains XRE-family HTH domain [Oribacterium sp. WCC10]